MRFFLFIFALQSPFLFSEVPPLFNMEGIYTHPIGTKDSLAQKYFDQGMVFYYGFNFDEAARDFHEAARIDPSCAICYWGEALALRGNDVSLNDPRIPLAMKSIQQAQRLISGASPEEQAYIRALANSYLPHQDSLKDMDAAYRDEMDKLSKEYPDDLDVKSLAANARMEGINGGNDVLRMLKQVLAKDPNHLGALHYLLHTVESTSQIEDGLESAKKLEHLVPFAGHLLHMPSHIYFNLGRYHDSTLANQRAVKADEDLFAKGGIKGKYFAGYYFHNLQFLIASFVMEGKKQEALEAAQKALDAIQKEKPKLSSYTNNAMTAQKVLILQRFSDWDQILKEPEPGTPFGNGMWHFARSLAYLSQDNLAQSKLEAALIQKEQIDREEDWMNTLLKVAYLNAIAAIEEKEGDQEQALNTYHKAVQLEDTFVNADPPLWFMSSKEAYGNALLRAGMPEEAAEQFREDLKITPHKIWDLTKSVLPEKAMP
jgi:tetratricopeptide (TPR) repeat protein